MTGLSLQAALCFFASLVATFFDAINLSISAVKKDGNPNGFDDIRLNSSNFMSEWRILMDRKHTS